MNSRQSREGRDKAQTIVSRRGRVFKEGHDQETTNPGQGASGDELDPAIPKGEPTRASRRASTIVLFRPVVVDLGMDVSSLFPACQEDKQKQGMLSARHTHLTVLGL